MEIKFQDQRPEKIKTGLLAVPVREKRLDDPALRRLDRLLAGGLQARLKKSQFTGAEGSALAYGTGGRISAANILLIGLGKAEEIGVDSWRKAGARARKEAAALGVEDLAFYLVPEKDAEAAAGAVAEGALLASYQFHKYRSDGKPHSEVRSLTLFRPGLSRSAALKRAVDLAAEAVPGVFAARDLVNEPPSVATARFIGEAAQRLCRGRGLSAEVWNKKKIQSMNLNGLLAVNRGSVEEPRFIVIRYRPQGKAKKRVALIGKGITFDSGGLSLKSGKGMETMKLDMAGGAAIIGAMSRLPELAPAVEVTGYIPTTDNLPSGSAQKPGDIIRYLNGKTIEVLNTDAEGRLILADGLALAAKDKPDCMINLATLTGACMVALGTEVAGLFSNDQPLADALMRAGKEAGEKLWQLPLVKEYRDEIKSSVADMKNIGGSYGGAITAALILQEFVDGIPWAHLDIAGPAFAEKEMLLSTKGGTGFGVRTLLRFLTSL
ncbi:MAG TPA: leucyl aminopeptidase [Verrucomicrobiae bacterium]|jgi:leucyl aminopeptidase|nr:leucyl aminopeptidase [Verrucomicrobiae bacterium]